MTFSRLTIFSAFLLPLFFFNRLRILSVILNKPKSSIVVVYSNTLYSFSRCLLILSLSSYLRFLITISTFLFFSVSISVTFNSIYSYASNPPFHLETHNETLHIQEIFCAYRPRLRDYNTSSNMYKSIRCPAATEYMLIMEYIMYNLVLMIK